MNKEHKAKFPEYYKALNKCKKDGYGLIVSDLEVLGDTIEEIKISIEAARENMVFLSIANLNCLIAF